MDAGPCRECAQHATCREPCGRLHAQLDSPDRGRVADNLRAEDTAQVEALLALAPRLGAKTDAVLNLYYRAGFAMPRIAAAFGVTKSSVSRRINTAWRRLARQGRQKAE